jgi:flagellar hook-basal body complex protein FliE
MSQIDVNSVLSQMRQLTSQADASPETSFKAADASMGQNADFGALLKQSIAAVGDAQTTAGQKAAAFERGDQGADLASTMIATQKAELSLSALTQVRNKLTDAYSTIMNMPV